MVSASGRVRMALACGTALIAGCTRAGAQDTETWRCSAANGHYEEHLIDIAGKSTITGRINMHSADFGSRWTSIAKVSIEDSKRSSAECDCAALVATGIRDRTVVDFALEQGHEQQSFAQSEFEKPITFRIDIDPQGLMTVRIGKTHPVEKVAALRHPQRDTLHLSCSGADVSFLNIDAH